MTYWLKFDEYEEEGYSCGGRMTTASPSRNSPEQVELIKLQPSVTGWYMTPECHQWFELHKIPYVLDWSHQVQHCWSVGVEDANHAMLVKLRWGGK